MDEIERLSTEITKLFSDATKNISLANNGTLEVINETLPILYKLTREIDQKMIEVESTILILEEYDRERGLSVYQNLKNQKDIIDKDVNLIKSYSLESKNKQNKISPSKKTKNQPTYNYSLTDPLVNSYDKDNSQPHAKISDNDITQEAVEHDNGLGTSLLQDFDTNGYDSAHRPPYVKKSMQVTTIILVITALAIIGIVLYTFV